MFLTKRLQAGWFIRHWSTIYALKKMPVADTEKSEFCLGSLQRIVLFSYTIGHCSALQFTWLPQAGEWLQKVLPIKSVKRIVFRLAILEMIWNLPASSGNFFKTS